MFAFDIVAEGQAELGESPVWDAAGDCVWWVDVEGCKLFRTSLRDRTTRTWAMPERTGFAVLRGPGRPALGLETGIYDFDPETAALERLVVLDAPGRRLNDATVDPAGRLWVTVMASDLTPEAASVCRVAPDLSLQTVVEGLSIPNGLAVDGERGRLYFSDSHWDIRQIWFAECDLATGAVGARTAFANTRMSGGRPDGAAFDNAGRYWIAALDDGALYVYSPAGELLDRVDVPFDSPTKLAFAGRDGRTLVVTSKAIGALGGSLAIGTSRDKSVSSPAQPFWLAGEV